MKADDIRDRLAALREAGHELRRRPPEATVDVLANLLDRWRDPASSWRRELEAELPGATGYSREVIREGLQLGLEPWSGDALRAQLAQEFGRLNEGGGRDFVTGFDATAVVLAGAIPMTTLLALIAPLALGSPVLAKTSAHDPVTARHVARSLADLDPLLGRCIDCVSFPSREDDRVEALLEADCVVAYGSDDTISAIRTRIAANRRLVAYGHRLSLAVIDSTQLTTAALRNAAARLALDIALWDQLGCLSPIVALVVDPDRTAAPQLAELLARALADLEVSLPRGRVDPEAAALASQERANAEIRAAAGAAVSVHTGRNGAWTVIAETDANARPAPLHRFIRVHPLPYRESLRTALAPYSRHLAAVALDGFEPDVREASREFAELGASRICGLGRMQFPPLSWRHDNRGVFLPLARLARLEEPL